MEIYGKKVIYILILFFCHRFAQECYLDVDRDVTCSCPPGYEGRRYKNVLGFLFVVSVPNGKIGFNLQMRNLLPGVRGEPDRARRLLQTR